MEQGYDCSRVVEIDQEPRHHLVIENRLVRAFAVEIRPQDRTLCHRHPNDYLLYVASNAEVISAARNEEPKRLNYRASECELSSAGLVHVVENPGDEAFRNIVVELLPAADGLARGAEPKLMQGDGAVVQLFSDERAEIFVASLPAGAEVTIYGPAVVAAPYDDKLSLQGERQEGNEIQGFRDLRWCGAGASAVAKNLGTSEAKVVLFQIGMRIRTGGA